MQISARAMFVAIPASPSVISRGKANKTGESMWLPLHNDATAKECPSPPTLAFRARAPLAPPFRSIHPEREATASRPATLPLPGKVAPSVRQ